MYEWIMFYKYICKLAICSFLYRSSSAIHSQVPNLSCKDLFYPQCSWNEVLMLVQSGIKGQSYRKEENESEHSHLLDAGMAPGKILNYAEWDWFSPIFFCLSLAPCSRSRDSLSGSWGIDYLYGPKFPIALPNSSISVPPSDKFTHAIWRNISPKQHMHI